MSSDKITNLVQTYIPLPAIISLLAAITIGVWTAANTLSEIRSDAKETRNELWTAKKEINDKLDSHQVTMEKQDGKLEVLQTSVTTLTVQSAQMQRQIDKIQP